MAVGSLDLISAEASGSMNFVKGVADLIRRTSAGQSGDFASASRSERFSLPSPKIRFRYWNTR